MTCAAGAAVAGEVAPGWEPVREALAANGSPADGDPGDLGAAMCVVAEAMLPDLVDITTLKEPVYKLPEDPRTTRVGRWLRRQRC